jgi:hypothetical protein
MKAAGTALASVGGLAAPSVLGPVGAMDGVFAQAKVDGWGRVLGAKTAAVSAGELAAE